MNIPIYAVMALSYILFKLLVVDDANNSVLNFGKIVFNEQGKQIMDHSLDTIKLTTAAQFFNKGKLARVDINIFIIQRFFFYSWW